MPEIRPGPAAFVAYVAREYRFLLATCAASGIGYLGSAAAPMIVQPLIESGLGYPQAGDLGTIELLALALTSTLVTPYVPFVSHRKLAVGGTLLAALGLAVSASSVGYAAMIAGRLLTGVGSGLAISGANAAVAAREDAERIFAIIWTIAGAFTATLAMTLPRVAAGGRYPLGFAMLLMLCIAGLPFIGWIPPRPVAPRDCAVTADRRPPTHIAVVERDFAQAFGPLTLMALAGIFLYTASEQALWNFAYNIPIEAGVDPTVASEVIALTTLMGLAGGVMAALLGVRLGRVFPIVLGNLLSGMGRWLYIDATVTWTLVVASLLWGIGVYFISPYQIGLVAAIDRKGRAAVAAAGAMNFGYALGPGIAGRTLESLGRNGLLAVILVSTLASMLLLVPLAIRVDSAARVAAKQRAGER